MLLTDNNWQELLLTIQHALNNCFLHFSRNNPELQHVRNLSRFAGARCTYWHGLRSTRQVEPRCWALVYLWRRQGKRSLFPKTRSDATSSLYAEMQSCGNEVSMVSKLGECQQGDSHMVQSWSHLTWQRVPMELHVISSYQMTARLILNFTLLSSSIITWYHLRTRTNPHPAQERNNSHDHYELDHIISHHNQRVGQTHINEFRLSFVGYGPEYDKSPEYNKCLPSTLLTCSDKIDEYHERTSKFRTLWQVSELWHFVNSITYKVFAYNCFFALCCWLPFHLHLYDNISCIFFTKGVRH